MTLLYPSFLWFLIPLGLFFFYNKKHLLFVRTHLLILMLIIITLSRPAIEEGLQESSIDAQDIIIALDVSYSMKAKDISPTRYDYAKEMINAFLKTNSKDNIMLIGFTSNPLLLSPPTTDHTLISMALESLNPKYILTKGTSLKKLFAKLTSMKQTHKELILITDGGEGESVEALAEQLKKTDLRLTVVALGTQAGTTIQKADGSMLKDKEGNLVVSRINPMLKKLTAEVNGNYIMVSASAESTAEQLQALMHHKERRTEQIKKMQYNYTELYQIPLLLAALLFLMLHTRASKYLLILFALAGMQAEASVWDGYYLHKAYKAYKAQDFNASKHALGSVENISLQSRIAEANTYYKLGEYKKAIARYKSVHSTRPKIKQMLFYNTANAYVLLKEYDKAKMYYTKALQLGEDTDALHNLSLVALLEQKAKADLGISHPKSQNSDASKSESQESSDEKKERDEDQPSSGSGTGGESKEEKSDKTEKKRLKLDKDAKAQPLSSKVYELINKGYIRETQPW
jgi:Ca-activated chloride channel family protein